MGKTQIETKQMIEEIYITLKYFRSQDFVMKFAIVHSGQTVNVRYYSGKLLGVRCYKNVIITQLQTGQCSNVYNDNFNVRMPTQIFLHIHYFSLYKKYYNTFQKNGIVIYFRTKLQVDTNFLDILLLVYVPVYVHSCSCFDLHFKMTPCLWC